MGARRVARVGKFAPTDWKSIMCKEHMEKMRKYWQSQADKKEKRKEVRRQNKEAQK
jgi:hypothetical protein